MNISATSKHTKDQLLQENDYLKSIFMTMNEGLIITDTHGVIQKINTAVEEMLGYTEAELIGKHCVVLSAEPYTIGKKPSSIKKLFAEGSIKQMEARYKKKDGTVFYAEVSSRLLKSADGAVTGAIGVIRDLTRRKQAEERLHQSQERYRLLTDTAPDAIITANGQGVIVLWNQGAEKMYGFKAEEIIGQDCVLIMPEYQREQHTRIFTMLLKAGKPVSSEIPAEGLGRRKEGLVFPVEQTFNLHWPNNEPFFTIIVRDISRRKAVEKKLYESEELFRLSFENAPIGICIFDKNGVILQANRFCEQCFDRSRDDIMRQGFSMFLHPDDRDKTTQALLSLANIPETNERLCVLENRYFSADGSTIYTKQHIQGYYDEAGSLSFVIVLTEDITAAQQLSLTNAAVIRKLKEVHSQLKEFNDLLPDSRKFLSVKSLSDYGFSSMENRIAAMIYHGHTNKKIAQQLCISENTVKHHITSMYTKCRVKNRIGFINSIRTNRIAI